MFPLPELCIIPARGHEVTSVPSAHIPGARPLAPGRPRQCFPVHTTLVSTLLKHLSLDRQAGREIEIPLPYRTIFAAETTRAPQGRAPRVLTGIY